MTTPPNGPESVFDLGMFPNAARDLVELIAAGKLRSDNGLLVDVLGWFRDRGLELSGNDPQSPNRAAVELAESAESLLDFLAETSESLEDDHRGALQHGSNEAYARHEAAAIRGRYHTAIADAFQVAVIAAGLGLSPHIPTLNRGKDFTAGPRKPRTDDLGKCLKSVLDDLGNDASPRAVWDYLMLMADAGKWPFDVIIPDTADTDVMTWKRRSSGEYSDLSFDSFKRRLRGLKRKRRTPVD